MSETPTLSKVYWIVAGSIALCISVTVTLMQLHRDGLDRRFQDRLEAVKQLEARVVSDIDQLDKRIANNAANLRALTISLGLDKPEPVPDVE